jgi:hypothetical protein
MEVISGMAAEAGFLFKLNERNFQTDYIPNVRDAGGKFEGWTLRGSATSLMADIMARLTAEYHSKGSIFVTVGFDANGMGDASGDPKLDADLERALKERDVERKKELIWDIQRYIAKEKERADLGHPALHSEDAIHGPTPGNGPPNPIELASAKERQRLPGSTSTAEPPLLARPKRAAAEELTWVLFSPV